MKPLKPSISSEGSVANIKTAPWRIRDGNERDIEGILSLRDIVFKGEEMDKLDPKFWRWEFIENPDGRAFIYLVEDQDKIIGHFADIPRRFSVAGETVRGTLSLDLMVHPDYRRKGIFEEMGRYGAQRVKQERGAFLFAFPIRPETIEGLKKIGWREVVQLPVLVYPLSFYSIINRYLRFQPLSLLIGGAARFFYLLFYGLKGRKRGETIETERVGSLDDSFEHFWHKASSLFPILGVRDRPSLSWRYLRHPTRAYTLFRAKGDGEMTGYIVLRKVDLLNFKSAVIVDLLALNGAALQALVQRGIEYSRQEGVDLLGFMGPRNHPYDKHLRKNGFLPSPKTFQFMIYPHTEKEIFLSPESWYVNWGDTDVL